MTAAMPSFYPMAPAHLPAPLSRSSFPPVPSVSGSHAFSDDLAADPTKASLLSMFEANADEDEEMNEDDNPFKGLSLDDVLDELNTRFLINLPSTEWPLERLYWQAEQAHWFYEDFVRPINPHLPSMSQKNFTEKIIQQSPLYEMIVKDIPRPIKWDHVWAEHMMYRKMVPCCGAIILNEQLTKCLVVQGIKSSAGWCFPRGKINRAEPEETCAIREVEEETGFDISGRIRSEDKIQTFINAQMVTMFIIAGVPENTVFEAQTRNEIGAIMWVKLKELPTWTGRQQFKTETRGKKFFNVTPFIGPLKRWVNAKKSGSSAGTPQATAQQPALSTQKDTRTLQPYSMHDASSSPHTSPFKTHTKRPLQHAGSSSEEENVYPSDMFASKIGRLPGPGGGGSSPAVDSTRLAELFQGLSADPPTRTTGGTAGTPSAPGGPKGPALLGGSATEGLKRPSEDRVAALLALLGGGPAPPAAGAASPPPVIAQARYGQPPYPSTSTMPLAASPAPAGGHQASMLAMLSPPPAQPALPVHPAPPYNYDASRQPSSAPPPPVPVPPGVDPAQHASVLAMLEDFGYPASAASVFLPKPQPPAPPPPSPPQAVWHQAVPTREWQPKPPASEPARSPGAAAADSPAAARHRDMLATAFAGVMGSAPGSEQHPASVPGPQPGGHPSYGQKQSPFRQPGPGAYQPGYHVPGPQQYGSGFYPSAQAPQQPGQQGYGQR